MFRYKVVLIHFIQSNCKFALNVFLFTCKLYLKRRNVCAISLLEFVSKRLVSKLPVVKKRAVELGEKGKKMRTPRAREEEDAELSAVSLTPYALALGEPA